MHKTKQEIVVQSFKKNYCVYKINFVKSDGQVR